MIAFNLFIFLGIVTVHIYYTVDVYIHFNLLSFYLVKSKASCNFCNVEDTIWVQEQTICSAVSIAVFLYFLQIELAT